MNCDPQIKSQLPDGDRANLNTPEGKRNILDISAQKWYELNLKKGFEGDRYLLPRPDFVGSCLNWPVKMSYLTQVKIYDDMEAKRDKMQDQHPYLPNQAVRKSPYLEEYNKSKGQKQIKYSKIAAVGKKTALAAWKAVSSMPGYRFEGDAYGIPRPSGDETNPLSYDDILSYRQAIEEHKLKIQQERQRKIQEREDAIRKKYTHKFMTALRIEYSAARHVTEDMMKTGVDRIVNELIRIDRERGEYSSPFKLEEKHRTLASNLFGSASKTNITCATVPASTSTQGTVISQPQIAGGYPKQGTSDQIFKGGHQPIGRGSISHSSQIHRPAQMNRPTSRNGQLQRPVQSNGSVSRDRSRQWPTQIDRLTSRGGQQQRSVQSTHGNCGRPPSVTSGSASPANSQLQRPLQSDSVASASLPRTSSPPHRSEQSTNGRQMSPQNPIERNTVTNIQAPTWRETLRNCAWSSPRPGSQPHRSESIGVPQIPPRAVQSHVPHPSTRTVPFNSVPGVSISVPGPSNNREHSYVSPLSFYVSPDTQTNWNRIETHTPVVVPGRRYTGPNVSPQRSGQRNMGADFQTRTQGQKNRGASLSPQRPQQKNIAAGVSSRKPGQNNRRASISPQRSNKMNDRANVSPQKQGHTNKRTSVSPQRPKQKNNAAYGPQGPGNKNRGNSVSPQRSDRTKNGAMSPTRKPCQKSVSPQRTVNKNMGAVVSSKKTVQKNREASISPKRPDNTDKKVKVLHQKQGQKNREASISPQRQGKQNIGKSVPLKSVGQKTKAASSSPQRADKRNVGKNTSPQRAEQKKSRASVPLQRVKALHSR